MSQDSYSISFLIGKPRKDRQKMLRSTDAALSHRVFILAGFSLLAIKHHPGTALDANKFAVLYKVAFKASPHSQVKVITAGRQSFAFPDTLLHCTVLSLILCNPMHCGPPGSSIYRDSPGKNT